MWPMHACMLAGTAVDLRRRLDASLAREIGQGAATLATAARVGAAYGSDVFRRTLRFIGREARQTDKRTHKKMLKRGLAYRDVLSYKDIPVWTEAGQVELLPWPMLLPGDMAWALGSCPRCLCSGARFAPTWLQGCSWGC